MLIVTVDMPSLPQQVIERDVSVFQTASKKAKQPQKTDQEANERKFIEQECQVILNWCASVYPPSSSAYQQLVRKAIRNYLTNRGTPVSLKRLNELEKSQWKGYV